MSDELRVPGYVTIEKDMLLFRAREDLSEADAAVLKERFKYAMRTQQATVLWREDADAIDAAAQRAYGAFWGVLGPVSEQWAHMSEERKECWRGVVRAVLDEA